MKSLPLQIAFVLALVGVAHGQTTNCQAIPPSPSPNIGFNYIAFNACNWGTYTNQNWATLDSILAGLASLPNALAFNQVTAGQIVNPPSGVLKLYANSADGFFHSRNSAGIDTALGGGGGGGGGFYQTFFVNGTQLSQQTAVNFINGSNMSIVPTTVSGVTTLTFIASGGGTPGGSTGQFQFNNAGAFAGVSPTGTGLVVLQNSPSLVTPDLGVPAAINLTHATGFPIATLSTNGVSRPDGTTIGVDGTGKLSVVSGGGSVTWPTSGVLLVSTASNSPAGLAPVNGNCVVGAGGAWTVGSCSGSAGTNYWSSGAGVPIANCTPGQNFYQDTSATNVGTSIYFCSATNIWSPLFTIDTASGITYGTGPTNGLPQIGNNTTAVPLKTNANTFSAVQTFSSGVVTSSISATGLTPTATVSGSGCALGTIVGTDVAGIIPMNGTTGTASCTVTLIPAVSASVHYFCSALQKRNSAVVATQSSDSSTSAAFAAISVTSSDVLQYGACIKQ